MLSSKTFLDFSIVFIFWWFKEFHYIAWKQKHNIILIYAIHVPGTKMIRIDFMKMNENNQLLRLKLGWQRHDIENNGYQDNDDENLFYTGLFFLFNITETHMKCQQPMSPLNFRGILLIVTDIHYYESTTPSTSLNCISKLLEPITLSTMKLTSNKWIISAVCPFQSSHMKYIGIRTVNKIISSFKSK